MTAQEETIREEESKTTNICSSEEFDHAYKKAEELVSVLQRLPKGAVINSGMQNRRSALLDRFEDLEMPSLDDDIIDDEMIGNLRSWIYDAKTLIHYIVFTGDTKALNPEKSEDQNSANELPVIPRLEVITSIAQAPAVSEKWHWPWIKGWDNPKKRKSILNPNKANKRDLKKKIMYGALGAAALYVGIKYFQEE